MAPQNFGKKFRGPPKILWPPTPEKKRKPPKVDPTVMKIELKLQSKSLTVISSF